MSSTLWIGTTGLAASEKQMDVIGNNLANANTVGFKAADTYFASMLSQSLSGGGGAQRVGQGVGVAAVSTIFAQGSFQSTGNATDVAVDGNGFFILKDTEGAYLYTRAGGFHVSNEGLLCDINKYNVQGHGYTEAGKEKEAVEDLDLRNVQSKPQATTYFDVGITLDSQTEPGGVFSTSQVVFDSRGAERTLRNNFTMTADKRYWSAQTLLDDTAAISPPYSGIRFDSDGLVDKVYLSEVTNVAATTVGAGDATFTVNNAGQMYKAGSIILTRGATEDDWEMTDNGGYAGMKLILGTAGVDDQVAVDFDGNGEADLTFALTGAWVEDDTIVFDIAQTETDPADQKIRFYAEGDSLSDGAEIGDNGQITWKLFTASSGIKSYATTSRISSLQSDGYAPGILTSLDINKNGIVEGVFSNGVRQNLARLLLADFPNIQGLNKTGSYFNETAESGSAVYNKPGSGGLGELQSNSLEVSNTDVAKEFIKMISAQRAYQSSARIITTADQMLQELMNIKR